MSIYLGIDAGTQSIKAILLDSNNGQIVSSGSAPLELISAEDGSREQHAHWWLEALHSSLAQLDPALKASISAIGISGQQHGFVPLAADGTVLAPVKLWCDTATTAQCQQLTEAFGGVERCIEELGNPILPGYTASKILWLKQQHPELYQQLDCILLPHDYLNYYLTGVKAMECGDASGTGLLDIRSRQWHPQMLQALDSERDLRSCLPELVAAGEFIGEITSEAASALGLPAGTPVSAGGGDNMMAAIGTGNVSPGQVTVSLGTSGTLFAYSDQPVIDDQGILAAFCDSTGGWLPLLCTMNCTVATELTRDLLDIPLAELDQRSAAVPAGANGVITLPFFQGERSPNLPNGRGCIFGLSHNNYTADNLLRSAMEAAIYSLRSGLQRFRELGCDINHVRLTGGGAKSAVWRQMAADIFNVPVSVQNIDEGAALGAALQACWVDQCSRGQQPSLAELTSRLITVDDARSCTPDPEAAQRYNALYQHYQRLVTHVTPLYQ